MIDFMKSKSVFHLFFVLLIGLLFSGCAKTSKITIYDQTTPPLPYEKIGTLEVKEKAYRFRSQDLVHAPLEVVSIGFYPSPSGADKLKGALNDHLLHDAKKFYRADAIINVTYWPELSSASFPDGWAHAKGEMIKFLPFAEKKTSEVESLHSESVVIPD